MPESRRHTRMRLRLFELLRAVCGSEHTTGSDQFVYFDAASPKRKLAPDAFVKLGVPDHDFDSFLTWEEGVPELAFEILSPSDSPERWAFEEKLRRYHALGVRELVLVDLEAKAGERLRVWDRIEHDLVERVITGEKTPCLTLGLTLVMAPLDDYPAALRLARDAEGHELVPTESESRRDAEAARRDAEAARRDAEAARRDAEARIAELEKLLGEGRKD